jgi:predicted type IV restriction endonuclease
MKTLEKRFKGGCMEEFKEKVLAHAEQVKLNGCHCKTEEDTKQVLILPFLIMLDFSPYDPHKVKAEYGADFAGTKGKRVDYALFSGGTPVMFIEAKPYDTKLSNHDKQLEWYFASTLSVSVAAITNGVEWRFFTDLKNTHVMDDKPFLTVNFDKIDDTDIEQLANFRYDMFNPDKLKSFAEQRINLDLLTSTIGICLREVDQDFVKFIATRANLPQKFTIKFLETITPLVKQSLKDAISEIVKSGLSTPVPVLATSPEPATVQPIATEEILETGDVIDPTNPKIITTAAERKLLMIVKEMLSGIVSPEDIIGKDTESYYNVLYQNKTNRWIVRYVDNKRKPQVFFPIELTEEQKAGIKKRGLDFGSGGSIILDKPESIMRPSEIIFDALAYCQNEDNFKRKPKVG